MLNYGTDKPDLRNPLIIKDVTKIFTREDVKSKQFNISVVADVSCDIDGPIATIKSLLKDPKLINRLIDSLIILLSKPALPQ